MRQLLVYLRVKVVEKRISG